MAVLAERQEAREVDAEDRGRPPEETLADTASMAVDAWDRAGTPMDPAYREERAAYMHRAYGDQEHMGG
jgi:hypothetical protein